MCTAEMCTSLIVASLPGLKALITRTVAGNTSRSTSGYNKSSDQHRPSQPNSRIAKISARLSRPQTMSADDSEFELISITPKDKPRGGELVPTVDGVDLENSQLSVKHDFTVEHDGYGEGVSYHNATSVPFV